MRVLITGGAGFIGYHVSTLLAKKGYDVVVMDNGSRSSFLIELKKQGIELITADVRDIYTLWDITEKVDAIIHLAALIDVEESSRKPLLYHEVNVGGTLNVLHVALKRRINHLVIASSAAVYGEPVSLPITESHPLNPLSVYGATKLFCEIYSRIYNQMYNLSVIVLRIFNVYGPGQRGRYSGVISRFIENALNNKPLTIYGDGKQTRDFIYVKDVANAFLNSLRKDGFWIFNIGSGKPYSILEIAKVIKEITGSFSKIIYEKERIGDIRHSYADISLAKKELGFYPSTRLEDGLKETIKWMSENLKSS